MKFGVLFSGGKDSVYTLYKLIKKQHKVVCLITIKSKNKDSFMFHTPNIDITKYQAEALNIPLLEKETEGQEEKELNELRQAIEQAKEKYKIEAIATGAIESVYQASRVQKICDELGLWCANPLWKKDQIELLNELIGNNFKVIISGVAGYPLDKSWIGKEINKELIEKLIEYKNKYQINPSGEGGEFETTVLDCPLFKKKIIIKDFDTIGEKNNFRMIIKNLKLEEK